MEQRIMKSKLYFDGESVDASQLMKDLQRVVDEDEKILGKEVDRKHPARKILNRFSGRYVSPTFLKSFMECPASSLISALQPYNPSAITSIGLSLHAALQDFYDLDGSKRTLETLDEITKSYALKNHNLEEDRNLLTTFMEGFKQTEDYLGGPMDHKNLQCSNEVFINGKFRPLGVDLPLPMYTLMDRLDIRDDGIYIIDYKVGKYFEDRTMGIDGYLPQLIAYKWAVEHEYGEKVKKAFLLTPGTTQKYRDLDIHNLKYQSMFIDRIFEYAEEVGKAAESKKFPVRKKRYCSYCPNYKNCQMKAHTEIEVNYDISYDFEAAKNKTKED